jgi:hypothetical protein
MGKAYTVLDEVFIAGYLQESSLKKIAKAMKEVIFVNEIEHTYNEEMLMENLGIEPNAAR